MGIEMVGEWRLEDEIVGVKGRSRGLVKGSASADSNEGREPVSGGGGCRRSQQYKEVCMGQGLSEFQKGCKRSQQSKRAPAAYKHRSEEGRGWLWGIAGWRSQ